MASGDEAEAPGLVGRRAIDYGWVIVAALSVTETVSWGILYYGFPVMLRPMEDELGWSRVTLTGAFSFGMAVAALAALPVGRWLDRHGPRALMTAGSCLAVALLVAWSRVESLPALYAIWAGLGLAMAATLYEPAFAAVVSWFPGRHRDRALLIVTLAGGLASTIFMPIAAGLLVWLGWRSALTALAVILGVVVIPIHALVLRPGPGTARWTLAAPDESRPPGIPLAAAARTGIFWGLLGAFFVGNFATVALTTHLIPYLADRGWSPTVAAATIGWMGAMQLPGRLLFAPIAARLGHVGVTASIFLVQAAALAQVALVARLPTLAVAVVMQGAANGMATLARATTVAALFGTRHYGSIGGAVGLAATGARAAGPVGAALLHAALGGYEAVFWTLSAALVVAGLAVIVTAGRR